MGSLDIRLPNFLSYPCRAGIFDVFGAGFAEYLPYLEWPGFAEALLSGMFVMNRPERVIAIGGGRTLAKQ